MTCRFAFAVRAALLSMLALSAPVWAADGEGTHLQPLNADELSQVSAAGLPSQTLDGLARGGAAALSSQDLQRSASQQEQQAALERQLALAQLRLGLDNVRVATQVMQAVALTSMATPVAPVLMPMMAAPFPFAMPPSSSSSNQH